MRQFLLKRLIGQTPCLPRLSRGKGKDEYAIKHVCMSLYWLGHTRLTFRSGQENSIEDRIRELKKKTGVEVVRMATPVGASQSNGLMNTAAQDVQRQTDHEERVGRNAGG